MWDQYAGFFQFLSVNAVKIIFDQLIKSIYLLNISSKLFLKNITEPALEWKCMHI